MLSRLCAHASMQKNIALVLQQNRAQLQNAMPKRCGGHNTMMIKPTAYDSRFLRNWWHFYVLLIGIPTAVITVIINIRANPELIEIPEGYEPRHWEYYKHPVSRWVAKNMYYPMELEHELIMAHQEYKSEAKILRKLASKVDRVMRFYNDHRSKYFTPAIGADYIRKGREEWSGSITAVIGQPSEVYEEAYKDNTVIAVEGFKDGPLR